MSAALFDPGLENKQTPVIQRNYFSQANSVAGSYVLDAMFYEFGGMVGFREELNGFPTTFVFNQDAKVGESCESGTETSRLRNNSKLTGHLTP